MSALLGNYWIVWPVGIAIWLVIGWAEFGYFEAKAFQSQATDKPTLSYFVYYLTSKFPLATWWSGILVGAFWGSLSVHFWAHWCPPGSISAG